MSTKIITAPSVYVAGQTTLNADGIEAFANDNGLSLAVHDTSTPIGKILAVASGDLTDYTHGEIMPELAGRFCYRSFERGRSTEDYNNNILAEAHGNVTEHTYFNLIITGVSRSLSHELVRHRVGFTPSQESQRFVNADDINFVMPPAMMYFLKGDTDCGEAQEWLEENERDLADYVKWQSWFQMEIKDAIARGEIAIDADIRSQDIPMGDMQRKQYTRVAKRANEAARSRLPNDCETRLMWTGNIRAFRHIIETRGAEPADLEIRRLAVIMAKALKELAPTLFADVQILPGSFGVERVVLSYHKV